MHTGARVLIPSHDETELLARHRKTLPPDIILPVASHELLAKANDKAFVQRHAESLGIPTPRLIAWRDLMDLARVLGDWDGAQTPVIVTLARAGDG